MHLSKWNHFVCNCCRKERHSNIHGAQEALLTHNQHPPTHSEVEKPSMGELLLSALVETGEFNGQNVTTTVTDDTPGAVKTTQ